MNDDGGVDKFLGKIEAPEVVTPVSRLLNDSLDLEFLLEKLVS